MGQKKTIARLTISPAQTGKKILDILKEDLLLPNRQIKKIIATQGIFLNGNPTHSLAKVHTGQILKVSLPLWEQVKIDPVPMDFQILYEDNWLLAVVKPCGLNVHQTESHESPALANGIVHYLQKNNLTITPRPINRLDKDASGIVLFAKSADVQTKLNTIWHTPHVLKKYWALVEGIIKREYKINIPIKNKSAETICSPLTQYKNYAEVAILIFTGRNHQIRQHLQQIGHPILGDKIYNPHSTLKVKRLCLHAWQLELIHPITLQKTKLEAPFIKEDFLI